MNVYLLFVLRKWTGCEGTRIIYRFGFTFCGLPTDFLSNTQRVAPNSFNIFTFSVRQYHQQQQQCKRENLNYQHRYAINDNYFVWSDRVKGKTLNRFYLQIDRFPWICIMMMVAQNVVRTICTYLYIA